jgi:hypothetical protein
MFANLKRRQNNVYFNLFCQTKDKPMLMSLHTLVITYIGIEKIERHRTTPQFNRGVFSAWHHLPREPS